MSSDPNIPPADPSAPAVAEPGTGGLPGEQAQDVKFTRAAALWSSLILGFLILIVLLIFIAQNTAATPFTFLSWHWSLPLGVAILLAAVCGGLITALVSAARMFQLRRVAKRNLQFARKK
ncbi:MAG: DUF1049 domain-containing protein [Mycobacterium sp.]|nr:DUF1049 domain-containing protein [Mycobacterium sp.]